MNPTAPRPAAGPGCLGRDILVGFDSGSLPDEEMEAVAHHLSTCPACAGVYREFIEGTPANPLDEYLRRPPAAPDNPAFAAMLAAARALPFGPPADGESTSEPTPESPPSNPEVIGPYSVRRILGSGGMGVVYEAVHPVLNRPVAVKMIRDANLDRVDSLDRFRTEAEAVARLRHPNVVEVIHFDEWKGLPYLVMELVPGRTLARTLLARGGTLPPREAAEVVRKLAAAVGYAHDRKVLHRDLKPGNVLVADDGTPKVTDFGLAKLLDDGRDGPTAADTVLGTPSYMAPEQARGDVAGVGTAADVYSLGAILYECLTGRPPFRGGNKNQTLQLVLNTPPVPPSEVKPGVPPVLEAICLKCLKKEPGGRYASAAALADDLGRWLNAERTAVRPAGWFGRHRRQVAAAFVVGLAVGGGAVAAVTFDPDRPRREIEAKLDRGEAVELIGATGGPRWSEWVAGEDGSWVGLTDGAFTIDCRWKLALLELLPDPRVYRYHITAKVRHFKSADTGGDVGMYMSHQSYASGSVTAHSFIPLTFNDVCWDGELPSRIDMKPIPKHLNPVQLSFQLYAQAGRPAGVRKRFGDWGGATLDPAGEDNGRWHEVSLVVGPAGIDATWDGKPLAAPADSIRKEMAAAAVQLRSGVGPFGATPAAEYTPCGGVGLYVMRGTASFRCVMLTPMPDADVPTTPTTGE